LAVVAASLLFGLLVCEALLRAAGYTYPVFYEPDETRGYALRPGAAGLYRKEGRSFVRINSDGLRDREREGRTKPAGTFRVALLGDSYAEALQVEQDEAFWYVLEGLLNDCAAVAGRRVEVVNFGVSGYGTAQQLLTLRERVWAYEPDLVLLAVTTNNDLTDNTRALKATDEIPYFVLRDGELMLDDSFRRDAAFRWRLSNLSRLGRWLREHLRFVQAAHEGQAAIKSALAARRARAAPAAALATAPAAISTRLFAVTPPTAGDPATRPEPPPAAELGTANMVYAEPPDDLWRGAWQITEALISAMHREVAERGVRFVVVTLSNPIQVHPDPAAREAFARRLGVPDLFYPERRFKALGDREGFPVLNLAPDLQTHAEANRVFLHGFPPDLGNGHWNQTGHRVAGQLLAPQLCAAAAP
jgi:lysophospholipase L1-like esterase